MQSAKPFWQTDRILRGLRLHSSSRLLLWPPHCAFCWTKHHTNSHFLPGNCQFCRDPQQFWHALWNSFCLLWPILQGWRDRRLYAGLFSSVKRASRDDTSESRYGIYTETLKYCLGSSICGFALLICLRACLGGFSSNPISSARFLDASKISLYLSCVYVC